MLRRLLGDDVDPILWPNLAVSALATGSHFAFFAFFPIWAIGELGAPEARVGLAYAATAAVGVLAGIVGGRLGDRVGRRPVLRISVALQASAPLLLVADDGSFALGAAALLLLGSASGFRWATNQAFVADLVGPEGRTRAFGAFRVSSNVGATAGPALGAILVAVGWRALFAFVAVLGFGALLAAARLPRVAPIAAPAAAPSAWRALVGDRAFALVWAASALAWTVYYGFELLLPVALTDSHGYSASTWGPLLALNAVSVILFQLRVTRWSASWSPAARLSIAMALMAPPFLLLELSAALPVVVAIALVFVVGEMLWAPASQALASDIAPAHLRGTYLGAIGTTTWVGTALAPAVGLNLREAAGDGAMWLAVAVAGAFAAGLFALACARPVVTARAAPLVRS